MTIHDTWRIVSLGEVATLVKGISYASEDYCGPDEGAIFITIKCVSKAGGFKTEGIKYFKGDIPENQSLKVGDLLIANTDLTRAGDIVGCPITVPPLTGASITLSMDLSKLIEKPDQIDRRFLYYRLMSNDVRSFMKDHASGSTVLHLQTRAVPGLSLSIPASKNEQSKIAEILATIDQAIEQTEALIAKQQRIKTGLMQDLLTRGIDEHGQLRTEQTHAFKESPLGRIPVKWEVVPFSHFVEKLESGVSVNADDQPCGVGQIGVLKTSAIYGGKFFADQNKTVIDEDLNRVRVSPRKNTILISRMNTPNLVGESGFVDEDHPNLYLPDRIWMTKFRAGKEFASKWMSFVLTSKSVRAFISLNATGTSGSMKNLPQKSLMAMLIASPNSESEIHQITKALIQLETPTNGDVEYLRKLRLVKTALMQDLLTGCKRVTDLLSAKVTA